jgi:DNA-binding Xre family transcriptional regulator
LKLSIRTHRRYFDSAMTESKVLVRTLRQTLSARGIRYRELAKGLRVSEATVKRTFSRGAIDLDRLSAICQFLDISFLDLAKLAEENQPANTARLTLAQEEALASDAELFYLFCLLAKGTSIVAIRRRKLWDERTLEKKIQALAKWKLVEWVSKTEVRARTTKNFECNSNGPIYRAYGKSLKDDFLADDFNEDSEYFAFATLALAPSTRRDFAVRLRNLVRDFRNLESAEKPSSERPEHVGLIIGFRPWVFSPIREKIRRAKNEK